MSAAAQRSHRPAGNRAATGQEHAGETGQYSSEAGKASSAKSRLTALKFKWLMQVAADPALPPASTPIAIFMAGKFLHPETIEAWPSISTLARLIGRSETQTRKGLHALVERGHLDAEMTLGGKGKTSRYRLAILPAKPFGNPQGLNEPNPAEIDRQTLRKTKPKPSGNPQGNPCNEPFNDSRRAQSAPAVSDHVQGSDSPTGWSDARKGASAHDQQMLRIGDKITVGHHGNCIVEDFGQLGRKSFVRLHSAYNQHIHIIVPVGLDRLLDTESADDESAFRTDEIRWGCDIGCSMPHRPGRATDAA